MSICFKKGKFLLPQHRQRGPQFHCVRNKTYGMSQTGSAYCGVVLCKDSLWRWVWYGVEQRGGGSLWICNNVDQLTIFLMLLPPLPSLSKAECSKFRHYCRCYCHKTSAMAIKWYHGLGWESVMGHLYTNSTYIIFVTRNMICVFIYILSILRDS